MPMRRRKGGIRVGDIFREGVRFFFTAEGKVEGAEVSNVG